MSCGLEDDVAALEHYQATRQKLVIFIRKSIYVTSLIQSLREQQVFLEMDLQLTLRLAGLGVGTWWLSLEELQRKLQTGHSTTA